MARKRESEKSQKELKRADDRRSSNLSPHLHVPLLFFFHFFTVHFFRTNLSQPANTLFRHNLTGTLETAIRSSNAQYDDPDILRRLDVRLLEISPGDSGWDVFSLDYHVDSPVNTILTPVAMHQYLKMFNFLWRLKRVEHALSSAWRRQTTSARAIRPILGKVC